MSVSPTASFSSEVSAFVNENKLLCVFTLGLAVVGYALGKLGQRMVAWLSECFGTTARTDEVGRRVLLAVLSQEEQFALLTEQGVHEILPGLFLGGSDYIPQPEAVHHLDRSTGPVHYQQIISATHWQPEGGFRPTPGVPVFAFPADPERSPPDVTIASFRMENQRHFQEALRTIDKALARGRTVFVHCQQGKDRSASIVIAYVMCKLNISFEEALTTVRAQRWIAEPGEEYQAFLRDEFLLISFE